MDDSSYLRILLDDARQPGHEPVFSEVEIDGFLERGGGNTWAAAAHGWIARAGMYHSMIDSDESGSKRKLSQLYDHAIRQATHYGSISGVSQEFLPPRVHGVPVSLRERDPGSVHHYDTRRH